MIATLPELIAPLCEPEFMELLRSRSSLHLQRGADPGRFRALIDSARLRELIETGGIKPDSFEVTHNTHYLAPMLYVRDGKVDRAQLNTLLARGASIITKPIQRAFPALNALCADIRARLGEPVGAAAVITTGQGGAVKMHYDFQDFFILQIEGSKRWRVYGPQVKHPIKSMPKIVPPDSAPVFDEVLYAGDLLFLPGGFWHHCDNTSDMSLHVPLMLIPRTGWHALRALLARLMADETLRVPLTRFPDATARAAHERQVKARLVEAIEHASLDALVAGAPGEQADPIDEAAE